MKRLVLVCLVVTLLLVWQIPQAVYGNDDDEYKYLDDDEIAYIEAIQSDNAKIMAEVNRIRGLLADPHVFLESWNSQLKDPGSPFINSVRGMVLVRKAPVGFDSVTEASRDMYGKFAGLTASIVYSPKQDVDLDEYLRWLASISADLDLVEASVARVEAELAGCVAHIQEHREAEAEFLKEADLCFIATAAYGTPAAVEIDALRQFRDEFLLHNPAGRAFVNIYYQFSPPIADFVSGHEMLRTVVRESLVDPVVNVVQLTRGWWGD